MKFGIIPGYQLAPVESPDYAAGLGRLAEELGFESIWPVEHVVMPASYASRYPYDPSGRMPIPDAAIPDPLIWLTWVAAATRRLRLGTAILILPQRNPVVLAKTLASLDVLSGGRLMLGIGVGWLREESEALGVRFDERGARTDEAVAAMRALWSEPVASFRGEHVGFEQVSCRPAPAQDGGIPIHVGGHSPAAARRAGRLGQGFLPLAGSLENLARLRGILEESARQAGRDPAAIEISCLGVPDLDSVRRHEDLGVSRMILYSRERDLEGVKRVMGPFLESAYSRGSAS